MYSVNSRVNLFDANNDFRLFTEKLIRLFDDVVVNHEIPDPVNSTTACDVVLVKKVRALSLSLCVCVCARARVRVLATDKKALAQCHKIFKPLDDSSGN